MKWGTIRDLLALIGAAYLAWLLFNFLVANGILHLAGAGY
jgi:threonine/homoserine/homoserine lactone efflux protein